MENYEKKKSGSGGVIVIILIIMVIGGVVVSNYAGPGKGWIDKLVKGKKTEGEKAVEPATKPEPPKPVEPEKVAEETKKPEPEKKEEKSEVKVLYDELFAKYRKKYPDPEIGKEYDVYLKSGTVRGKLKEFSEGKIVIQKPGVTVTYRLDMVSKKSYPELFPQKAAKILALNELKKVLEEKAAAAEAESKEQEYTVENSKAAASALPGGTAVSTKFAYDPEPQATPARLKKPLAAFGDWVMVQQRRVGGKLGEKIYAKKQGRNVVLYVQTSKLFRQQDYDVRFTVAEGMWQIWGFKCLDYGAARATSQTHIVLLDNKNKIIGGSSIDDSSNIWVKK